MFSLAAPNRTVGIVIRGEVSEWLKVPISKIGRAQKALVGSNPTLSAIAPSSHLPNKPRLRGKANNRRGAGVAEQARLESV